MTCTFIGNASLAMITLSTRTAIAIMVLLVYRSIVTTLIPRSPTAEGLWQ
jgi:putative drug exporter of the RND superfamily